MLNYRCRVELWKDGRNEQSHKRMFDKRPEHISDLGFGHFQYKGKKDETLKKVIRDKSNKCLGWHILNPFNSLMERAKYKAELFLVLRTMLLILKVIQKKNKIKFTKFTWTLRNAGEYVSYWLQKKYCYLRKILVLTVCSQNSAHVNQSNTCSWHSVGTTLSLHNKLSQIT